MAIGEHNAMVPHVLVFPFPAQGHINTMLRLAELLSISGLHVTFLNTHHNHDRLLRFGGDVHARLSSRPGFQFLSISDGLPADDHRSAVHVTDLHMSLCKTAKPQLRELLVSGQQWELNDSTPVTCIIADGVFSFAVEVGGEVGIPVIAFRTISACAFWAYFCIPNLIKGSELPFPDEADMDGVMNCVPGMEGFLRRRDLPLCFRSRDLKDPMLQLVLTESQATTRASAILVNTFESLESPVLSHIRSHIPNTYVVGPLHSLVQSLRVSETSRNPSTSISLWEEDRSCMAWLDSQPHKSVVYVSYGSLTVISRDELLEFWHGLVDSGQRFLWVLRSNLIGGNDWAVEIPPEVEVGTRERGCLVQWAPQEEVLRHPAVGGFLTHSGWNSTLESLVAGVPMLCWPFFADQQVNSRYVSEVWRVGLDMKDTCSRITVEKMVRELMDGERAVELRRSASEMAEMARGSVGEGGSSHENFKRMINDIKFKQLRVPSFENRNAT